MTEPATKTPPPPPLHDRIAALTLRLLDQGLNVVHVERPDTGLPGVIRGSYAGEAPVLNLPFDIERLSDPEQWQYFLDLLGEVGKVSLLKLGEDGAERPAIEDLARRYICAWMVAQHLGFLKDELLSRMAAESRVAVECKGLGAVTIAPGGTRRTIDGVAVQAKLNELVAELEVRGGTHHTPDLPMKESRFAHGLKVVRIES